MIYIEYILLSNFKIDMAQEYIWEKEYQKPALLTKKSRPQKDVTRFLHFLRKTENVVLENLKILDLGSGTGRNANYLALIGNYVVGLEISDTALSLAKSQAKEIGVKVDYLKHNIGIKYPFKDNFFDLILDVLSSNSLNEKERKIYLSESHRVLKNGGYFFVKALCKEGDKNAHNLLKSNPGKEQDTYILKGMGVQERVFSKKYFLDLYSEYFKIINLTKKTNYTRFDNQSYKRNFWIAYLKNLNNIK